MALLTETADYDTPGSWGTASEGWPGIVGDEAYDMFVFANQVANVIPYGSYVLMSERGKYEATESYLRVHPDYIETLKKDFEDAGRPTAEQSIERRKKSKRAKAYKWWTPGAKMAQQPGRYIPRRLGQIHRVPARCVAVDLGRQQNAHIIDYLQQRRRESMSIKRENTIRVSESNGDWSLDR